MSEIKSKKEGYEKLPLFYELEKVVESTLEKREVPEFKIGSAPPPDTDTRRRPKVRKVA